jgi:hypothetical protein
MSGDAIVLINDIDLASRCWENVFEKTPFKMRSSINRCHLFETKFKRKFKTR